MENKKEENSIVTKVKNLIIGCLKDKNNFKPDTWTSTHDRWLINELKDFIPEEKIKKEESLSLEQKLQMHTKALDLASLFINPINNEKNNLQMKAEEVYQWLIKDL